MRLQRHHALLSLAALAASVGCAADEASLGRAPAAIVDGTLAPDDVSVAMLRTFYPGFPGGVCTGTLIARRVVLTAAHCVAPNSAGVQAEPHVFFGPVAPTFPSIVGFRDVAAFELHPDYAPHVRLGNDLALLLLADDPGVPPVPLRRAGFDVSMLGTDVRDVGFGRTDGEASGCPGCGTRRQVTIPLLQFDPEQIAIDVTEGGPCNGDSGGPMFIVREGREELAAVNGWGRTRWGRTGWTGCTDETMGTRVDTHVADFIDPWVLANDTVTCEGGDYCAPDCERIDPDCDPRCGPDGACLAGCESPDPDCPLAAAGARCVEADECASGFCVPAPDEPRLSYCIAECDPALATSCPEGMTCAAASDARHVCVWPSPSPGALGGACETGADCADGVCVERGGEQMCSRECDVTNAACPDGFECIVALAGQQVCVAPLPAVASGCAVVARGSTSGPGVLVLAAALVALRRRRSRAE